MEWETTGRNVWPQTKALHIVLCITDLQRLQWFDASAKIHFSKEQDSGFAHFFRPKIQGLFKDFQGPNFEI